MSGNLIHGMKYILANHCYSSQYQNSYNMYVDACTHVLYLGNLVPLKK